MKRVSIYLMAGKKTPELATAAVAGGADLLEIGFPFSDPLADGPVIRLAGERALAEGMRTRACLDCLAETRARVEVPLIPMTYASILEAYGYERFRDDALSAGATSFIVADLPLEAAPDLPRVQSVSSQLTGLVERARALTDMPLFAGFGISTPEQAAAAAELADGIVVGSRAVEVAESEGSSGLERYVRSLRTAVDDLTASPAG